MERLKSGFLAGVALLTLLHLSVLLAPGVGLAQGGNGGGGGNNNALLARVEALEATVTQLQTQNAQLQTQNTSLSGKVAALENVTQDMSRDIDPNTGQSTVRFSGVNVQIVDGSGDPEGDVNGLGNLIIGYNELRFSGDDRSGSHNLIVGTGHTYTSFGSLVAGLWNTVYGEYASVSGGRENTASGTASSVSGGYLNIARGYTSSVSGGYRNMASGDVSSVSGGFANTASGLYSSVSGGNRRTAAGWADWAAGSLFQDQ